MILKIEFDESVWVKIADMIATQPFKDASPILAALSQQFQAQREDAPTPPPERDLVKKQPKIVS